jgi:hypothetical protein
MAIGPFPWRTSCSNVSLVTVPIGSDFGGGGAIISLSYEDRASEDIVKCAISRAAAEADLGASAIWSTASVT